jgi:chromosome segregation ATPase
MNKKITPSEKKRAEKIKGQFSEVHSEISQIQLEMDHLNKKAESLIKSLEGLREEEKEFISSLEKKYGKGSLDPFNMIYKITTQENEENI